MRYHVFVCEDATYSEPFNRVVSFTFAFLVIEIWNLCGNSGGNTAESIKCAFQFTMYKLRTTESVHLDTSTSRPHTGFDGADAVGILQGVAFAC